MFSELLLAQKSREFNINIFLNMSISNISINISKCVFACLSFLGDLVLFWFNSGIEVTTDILD